MPINFQIEFCHVTIFVNCKDTDTQVKLTLFFYIAMSNILDKPGVFSFIFKELLNGRMIYIAEEVS